MKDKGELPYDTSQTHHKVYECNYTDELCAFAPEDFDLRVQFAHIVIADHYCDAESQMGCV